MLRRDGNVSLHSNPQIEVSDYQKSLDAGNVHPETPNTQNVRYWSDFNRVFYHPRSIIQLNEYEFGSSLMPFEKWDTGDLFTQIDREEDILDRDLRPWAEECDQMQGINVWAGTDDSWGGFCSQYVDRIRDEYGKLQIWTWGIEKGSTEVSRVRNLISWCEASSLI